MIKLIFVGVLLSINILANPATANDLDEVLASSTRSDENKSRDQARHPKETIEFFGTKPTDHIMEVWPGDGWYSEILASYVKEQGLFTAITFGTGNINSKDKKEASWSKNALLYTEKMSNQDVYGEVNFFEFEPPKPFNTQGIKPVDVAYVIRTLHIWDELGAFTQGLKSIYDVLKPGGVLAIVQHRGNAISQNASSAVEGYLDERYVINTAERNGFKLVASSEINLNLKDTKDHPKGVYALPPVLAMGSKDRDRYLTIGESDRMTLKFIKTIN
jgi:predicted methyltransferase